MDDDKKEKARLDDEPVARIPWSLSHLECGCLWATLFRISRYGGMDQNLRPRGITDFGHCLNIITSDIFR